VAYDVDKQQVIAFEIGHRDKKTLQRLWEKIPERLRQHCDFISDDYDIDKATIPEQQHYIGKTLSQRMERFFNTLRQRCSRLLRKTLYT